MSTAYRYFKNRDPNKTAYRITFTIEDAVGSLEKALIILKDYGISLQRIESSPSKTYEWDYDILLEFEYEEAKFEDIRKQLTTKLATVSKEIKVVNDGNSDVSWFPIKLSDLDTYANKTMEYGDALDADHPGFKDPEYRKRRQEITNIAKTYKTGSPIPEIEYTAEEIGTWEKVYTKLLELYPTHACKEHQYVFPLLIRNCGYGPKSIPQLEAVSKYLKECTGFTLRPVMGLLSSRDFLNGLAFRVFHSTQYIRHHSKPFYTPEPDVCHELLGHVPLFANPEFADFSQEIGLSSLGATDEDIEKLSTIYWFTVEFGLCRQDDQIRAYGAGLLSSFGELQYCLTDEPQKLPFEPSKTAVQKYPITKYQPLYFVAESFSDAQDKVRAFSASLKRPFAVRYNAYTQTIQVLDSKEKIIRYTANLQAEIGNLLDALKKL